MMKSPPLAASLKSLIYSSFPGEAVTSQREHRECCVEYSYLNFNESALL